MVATGFEESNTLMHPPEGMTADECQVLEVYKGEFEDGKPVVISCWKFTKEELEIVNKTGRIYILVLGESMPPIAPTATDPFRE